MKAILLISHGSRSPKTIQEIKALVNLLKVKAGAGIFEYAFLEIESPNISEGIRNCVKRGAKEILVLLNFLNSGKHVDEDIPQIVKEVSQQYPNVKVSVSRPVGQHEGIADLFLSMINE